MATHQWEFWVDQGGTYELAGYLTDSSSCVEALINEKTEIDNKSNIVQALLKAGANPNLGPKYDENHSPLLIACKMKHHKVIRELLKHPDTNLRIINKSNHSPLRIAYYLNDAETIQQLRQAGLHPDDIEEDGETPLTFACERGGFH